MRRRTIYRDCCARDGNADNGLAPTLYKGCPNGDNATCHNANYCDEHTPYNPVHLTTPSLVVLVRFRRLPVAHLFPVLHLPMLLRGGALMPFGVLRTRSVFLCNLDKVRRPFTLCFFVNRDSLNETNWFSDIRHLCVRRFSGHPAPSTLDFCKLPSILSPNGKIPAVCALDHTSPPIGPPPGHSVTRPRPSRCPARVEVSKGLDRPFFLLHRCGVMVQHVGRGPSPAGLDIRPRNPLTDGIGRPGPAETRGSGLSPWFRRDRASASW